MRLIAIASGHALQALGALWLLVELATYFWESSVGPAVRSYWYVTIILVVLYSAWRSWPKRRFRFLVAGRDVFVEFVCGDIFKEHGSIVVGATTNFESDPRIISPRSIQGQFSNKYFDDIKDLSQKLAAQSGGSAHPLGTVISVKGKKGRVGHFCAISSLNQAGVAHADIEDLRQALAGLWTALAEGSEKGVVNIPVLGSGFSRVKASREELVHEIVWSFFAALSDRTFCDGLRIVVHGRDVSQFNIDMQALVEFVAYNCRYGFQTATSNGGGTPE